jgi:16S rRNA (guanine527-N7)-methyltransferase
LTRDEFESATGVSRETAEGFDRWRALLIEANAHTNLVGRSTLDDFWERHALDSLQLMQLIPADTERLADLGAGAGFPGLALALAFRDRGIGTRVVMIDSVAKKTAFLNRVIAELGLAAEARAIRVEKIDPSESFQIVTARAFAPLNKLLGFAAPLLKSGVVGLFFKGRHYRDELTEARKHWTFECEVIPSQTGDGVILRISEVQRVR